jgi:hypothetical protein
MLISVSAKNHVSITALLACALIISACAEQPVHPQTPPSPIVQTLQEFWFYEGSLPPPAAPAPAGPTVCPTLPPAPAPLPTLNCPGFPGQGPWVAPTLPPSMAPKYNAAVVANGLDQYLVEAQKRVEHALPVADGQHLGSWHVVDRKCSTSGPVLLTSEFKTAHEICIAPLLVTSLFLSSVDVAGLMRFSDTLQRVYHIDPGTFTGSYDQALRGTPAVTQADWNAFLSSVGDGGASNFRTSADYLFAYVDYCEILTPTDPDCAKRAASIAAIIDGNPLRATGLVTALDRGVQNYDPASWGFHTPADGQRVLAAMVTATGNAPAAPLH